MNTADTNAIVCLFLCEIHVHTFHSISVYFFYFHSIYFNPTSNGSGYIVPSNQYFSEPFRCVWNRGRGVVQPNISQALEELEGWFLKDLFRENTQPPADSNWFSLRIFYVGAPVDFNSKHCSVFPLTSYDSSLHASSHQGAGGSQQGAGGFYRVIPTPTFYIVDRLE